MSTLFARLTSYVNQNASPIAGGAVDPKVPTGFDCPCSENNCGPNDEMFSPHDGGANIVFVDGHVAFLKATLLLHIPGVPNQMLLNTVM